MSDQPSNHCENIRPDMPECLQKGHRQLAAGVYSCSEEHCHINGPELCLAHGYPPTRRNIEMLAKVALEMFASGETKVVIVP